MDERPMRRAATAGAAYFAAVFAAGFALGTLRVLALAPALGTVGAVLVELPVMLAISWLACRWLAARFAVPPATAPRLAMGGLALVLLLLAELALSVALFGRTPSEHFRLYREIPALAGLAAQIAFAAFPLVQRRA